MTPSQDNNKNMILAFVLTLVVLALWQLFWVKPYEEKKRAYEAYMAEQAGQSQTTGIVTGDATLIQTPQAEGDTLPVSTPLAAQGDGKIFQQTQFLSRKEALEQGPRIHLSAPGLHGSMALEGARLDDLTLADYHISLDKNSGEVVLLSPSGTEHAYFVEFGWVVSGGVGTVPNRHSPWELLSEGKLTPENPVKLRWQSPEGLLYTREIHMVDKYLIRVIQKVENRGEGTVSLAPYGLINRSRDRSMHFYILHEGPLGVFEGTLEEVPYDDLREEENSRHYTTANGWLGITDKYWLTALIP
ncbi:MAG: membrane protein insertase YidC, partial [Rickettsiales bacterium]|nr:membrane protein insertase YidC [Rickettsiales bacterium]